MKKNSYLIVSGGTGGHVIPAVNFGNFIIDKGYKCHLIVDHRGKRYVKLFKGKLIVIRSSHFSYNFTGKFYALISLIIGFFQSLRFLIIARPTICVAFGSYSSFMPLTILSVLKFIGVTKIYLHEQNSVMGKVNNFFIPFVNKIFLNFEKPLNLKNRYTTKSLLVGLPINHKINYRLRNINQKNKILQNILICGGSQGAFNLNQKLMTLFMQMSENYSDRINISIQCPDNQKDSIHDCLSKLNIKHEIKSFFENFIEKLFQTDLLIARAGAGTIRDVIFTQTPTIFIPLPFSADNHQFYNANYLVSKKAALMFEQNKLNDNQFFITFTKLIKESKKKVNLIKNLQKIKNFDTNQLIYKHINVK